MRIFPISRTAQLWNPKLSRTEISDVIQRVGPMRIAVEAELFRLSGRKC